MQKQLVLKIYTFYSRNSSGLLKMVKISKFGENFLFLALRIDKHIKGYIDFYFGPEKIKKVVENESLKSPYKLLNDCNGLIKKLEVQGYGKTREHYLTKLLTAMKMSVENLIGIEIPLEEQFLRLYDAFLKPVNESEFENLRYEFNKAYGGFPDLGARMVYLREIRKVPETQAYHLFKKALKIVKKQTEYLFQKLLPENEKILIELVGNNESSEKIKWNYYNWYLGNFTSRIEVNPSYGMYWTSLLSNAAHEGYPGHHTHFVLTEEKLYRELNQFEHSLLIFQSPKLIIAEGIADLALSVLFSDQEIVEISLREFCPDSSKEDSLETLIAQNKIRRKISLFWYDFAYRALIEKYSDKKLIEYGSEFEIFSNDDIRNQIKRLNNPVYSKNAFTYNLGTKIIKHKFGEIPSIKNFRNLLVKPILPSDLL
jgi:hypothetical protein